MLGNLAVQALAAADHFIIYPTAVIRSMFEAKMRVEIWEIPFHIDLILVSVVLYCSSFNMCLVVWLTSWTVKTMLKLRKVILEKNSRKYVALCSFEELKYIKLPTLILFLTDSTPPNVNITSDDSPYSTRSPSFTFTSSEDATFKCAIDDTRFYTPCGKGLSGQFTASNVLDGRHAFFVQGTDDAGNVGEHKQYVFVVGKWFMLTRRKLYVFVILISKTKQTPNFIIL